MGRTNLAQLFHDEPGLAFVEAIRDGGRPVGKRDVVEAFAAADITARTVEQAWAKWLPLVKDHPRIRVVKTRSYEWTADAVTPVEALRRMRRVYRQRTPTWLTDALAEVVEGGLQGVPTQDPHGHATPKDSAAATEEHAARAAQERQWRIDVVRAVAEIAMAVEEITYKGADADGILERVRNQALARSLTPIGGAGERASFDPTLHTPLAGSPATGSPVVVIRPGYSWQGDGEDVLIERAVVRTV